MLIDTVVFPPFSGIRCLMMPYLQGNSDSVPPEFLAYREIINSLYFRKGDVGFLTIDESPVVEGRPHRGARARTARALHTEAGKTMRGELAWGETTWGGGVNVTLNRDVEILLANNLDDSCAVWNAVHEDTSRDGDIGHESHRYPYEAAVLMKAGEVHKIGILTPHESLPVKKSVNRQFLRIVSAGVHGRERYFTENPLFSV